MSKLLSTEECAKRHGVSRKAIHAAIVRGDLPAQRVGHAWIITEEACAGYRPLTDAHDKGKKGAAARWRRTAEPETQPSTHGQDEHSDPDRVINSETDHSTVDESRGTDEAV
jgi:hypothetical protein